MPRLPILVASLFLPMTLLSAQTPTQQYSYDAVGNMTSAIPDGIQSISYNELNLPEVVTLDAGNVRRIEQLYSADGEKLGRDCYDQSGARVSHRSYVGPLVLEDGVPVMLLVDGGYISIGTQNGEYSGDYHFFVGDHQGNVRAVVGEDGTIEQTAHYDPFGEMAVDNLSINRYLYSGKEWDLNQQAYDFGARIYMPAYSRFTTIDPLCEQDYRTSPYAYCCNNPVNRLDISGRWDIHIHLYHNRAEYPYGIAIVTDKSGQETFRFKVRGEGVKGHNRAVTGADTPTGSYSISKKATWLNGGSRLSYGPADRLNLSPKSGEIVDTGRSLIRIHGGRQEEIIKDEEGRIIEWKPLKNPKLKPTYGCIRAFDVDMTILKTITDNLIADNSEEEPGSVFISDDLVRVHTPRSSTNLIEVDTYYVIPTERFFQINSFLNL